MRISDWSSDVCSSDLRKRVERIWRREGLKVPHKQPKRGRLWLNDGSCVRLRPEYPGHVWAYDFVEGRTHDGRKFCILTIDRKSVEKGKSVSVGVDLGGRRIIKKKKLIHTKTKYKQI